MKKTSVVEAKFLRENHSLLYTRLWNDIDQGAQKVINSSFLLDVDEKPVLAYYQFKDYWWVLTSKKIVIKDNEIVDTIELHDIERIELNELFAGATGKMDNTSIDLYSNGKPIRIQLEKNSWPVIYKLLQFVIA